MLSTEKSIINFIKFKTPLGEIVGCATTRGVCLIGFTDKNKLETEFKDMGKKLNAEIIQGENKNLKILKKELTEYFERKRKRFTVLLDIQGTQFQQSAMEILRKIPYGETISYQQQAELLGNPKALRAVASANSRNKISIVIPCHRVIGKNGELTGYSGGLTRKKWLLEHEKNNPEL